MMFKYSTRSAFIFVALIGSLSLLSGCSDDDSASDSDGSLTCANGSVVDGALCDGTNDCSDGSDEVDCGSTCVDGLTAAQICDGTEDCNDGADEANCSGACAASLPEAQICDGTEDCDDGSDEFGCPGGCLDLLDESLVCDGTQDCDNGADEANCSAACLEALDDAQLCDGIDDCDGADEESCDATFTVARESDRDIFAGNPVTLRITADELDEETITLNDFNLIYGGQVQSTITRDGLITFRLPEDAAGEREIKITAPELGVASLTITVEEEPTLLSASEAFASFKEEFDEVLDATEVSVGELRNVDLPDELLDANETLLADVESKSQLLSADEIEFVAKQVNTTNLLMGAERPTGEVPAAIRKDSDDATCQDLRAEVKSLTDRVRAGVNLIANNFVANAARSDVSDDAKLVAQSIAYGYWTYLLRGALLAYDDYVDTCAEIDWEFFDTDASEPLLTLEANAFYNIELFRNRTLENPVVLDAMAGCELALVDVVEAYNEILAVEGTPDFSSLLQTMWRQPVDPESISMTLLDEPRAELFYGVESAGYIEVSWNELQPEDSTETVSIEVSDPDVSGTTIVTRDVNVTGSPRYCAAPSNQIPRGTYILSLSGRALSSPVNFEVQATEGEFPDETFLDFYPLVRDACTNQQSTGCNTDFQARERTGEVAFTSITGTTIESEVSVFLEGIFLDGLNSLDATNGSTFELSLFFKPCVGSSFCGSGTLTDTQTGGASYSVNFAAESVTDVSLNTVPTPKAECREL